MTENASTCTQCAGKGRIVILSRSDGARKEGGPPDRAEWRPCPKCGKSKDEDR